MLRVCCLVLVMGCVQPGDPTALHSGYGTAGQEEAIEQSWKAELSSKLKRSVTFEFVDTPLTEAMRFLETLMRATIVLDATSDDPDDLWLTPITYAATDTPLADVLAEIAREVGLTYGLVDHVIFVGRVADVAAMERLSALREERASRRDMSDADQKARHGLLRPISICGPDIPLTEVLAFLGTLTRVPIVADPEVASRLDMAVTLSRMDDIPLAITLVWILRPAGLTYEVRNGEIYISTPSRLGLE